MDREFIKGKRPHARISEKSLIIRHDIQHSSLLHDIISVKKCFCEILAAVFADLIRTGPMMSVPSQARI
jgi:hypothetical protein